MKTRKKIKKKGSSIHTDHIYNILILQSQNTKYLQYIISSFHFPKEEKKKEEKKKDWKMVF